MQVEQLNTVVLAVCYQHPFGRIDPNRVRCCELSWTVSGSAPRKPVCSVRGETVDPRVAIAVRDIVVPIRRLGDVGRVVEWFIESRAMSLTQAKAYGA